MTEPSLKQSVAEHKVGAGMVVVGLIAAALLAKRRMGTGSN